MVGADESAEQWQPPIESFVRLFDKLLVDGSTRRVARMYVDALC